MSWLDEARVTRIPPFVLSGVEVRRITIPEPGGPDPPGPVVRLWGFTSMPPFEAFGRPRSRHSWVDAFVGQFG